jgi:hypothetical protein
MCVSPPPPPIEIQSKLFARKKSRVFVFVLMEYIHSQWPGPEEVGQVFGFCIHCTCYLGYVQFHYIHLTPEVGRPLFWSTGPLSGAQQTTEMIADQRTAKNSGSALADYRNGAFAVLLFCIFWPILKKYFEFPLFRCSAFLAYFKKYFREKKIIK